MSLADRLGLGGRNWQHVYFILALFAVLSVVSGLLLTHRMTLLFDESVAVNKAWTQRLLAYSTLGQLVLAVKAPGNAIFDDADVTEPDIVSAEERLQAAHTAFDRAAGAAIQEAQTRLEQPAQGMIAADLQAVDDANHTMVAEARRIFDAVRRRQPGVAVHHMAMMERRYTDVNAAIVRLRRDAIGSARAQLDDQQRAADLLQLYEAIIAAAILGMVAAFAGYGFRISRRIKRDAAEREGLIDRLRDSEELLEQRVWARTGALSAANKELARLAAIVASSDDAIVSIDRGGRLITWNDAATRLFGYTADEIIGRPVAVIVPEHRLDEHRDLVTRVMRGDSLQHHRTERRRKDGSLVHVDLTVSAIRGEDGRVLGGSGILRDIGAQIAAEEKLAETARRLSDAQRMAGLGSWEFDLQTQAITWSEEMFRIFGLEPGETTPTYEMYIGLLHPDCREHVQASVARTIETGEPFERYDRIVRLDGRERILYAVGEVIAGAEGRPLRMVGSAQDITELRAAEAAVRNSEERFQYAARATNDALWDWDVPRGTVWWNDGFRTLFAHENPAPTLDFWKRLIHPDDADRVLAGIHHFLESTEEVWSDEYRFKRADGSYAWVLDRGYAIRDNGGRPLRMIGSKMDITDRKQAERMKSDFVSFVSHQLRTPLSGMSWMLELATDTPGIPEEALAHIADARESAARLASLVNDLLDIAKLESGRASAVPEPLALSRLTQSVVAEIRPIATGKALALAVTCDPSVRPVFADAHLLRQVLTNLLSNAVKYTPPGGRIAVSVDQRNGSVTWSVRDSGVGVPRRAQPRLFEKFYRADNAITMDAEGTGLGLHLVRLIVEQAGGRVWCESEEGQGATFAFTLPAMAAEKEAI